MALRTARTTGGRGRPSPPPTTASHPSPWPPKWLKVWPPLTASASAAVLATIPGCAAYGSQALASRISSIEWLAHEPAPMEVFARARLGIGSQRVTLRQGRVNTSAGHVRTPEARTIVGLDASKWLLWPAVACGVFGVSTTVSECSRLVGATSA